MQSGVVVPDDPQLDIKVIRKRLRVRLGQPEEVGLVRTGLRMRGVDGPANVLVIRPAAHADMITHSRSDVRLEVPLVVLAWVDATEPPIS